MIMSDVHHSQRHLTAFTAIPVECFEVEEEIYVEKERDKKIRPVMYKLLYSLIRLECCKLSDFLVKT
jgi:hypothetical protein